MSVAISRSSIDLQVRESYKLKAFRSPLELRRCANGHSCLHSVSVTPVSQTCRRIRLSTCSENYLLLLECQISRVQVVPSSGSSGLAELLSTQTQVFATSYRQTSHIVCVHGVVSWCALVTQRISRKTMRSACSLRALYCSLWLAVLTQSCRASTCPSQVYAVLNSDTLEKEYLPLGASRLNKGIVSTHKIVPPAQQQHAHQNPVLCSTVRFTTPHHQFRGACASTGVPSGCMHISGEYS